MVAGCDLVVGYRTNPHVDQFERGEEAAVNPILFAHELGRVDWVTDARFATNWARLKNKPALMAQLEPLLREKARADWTARFNNIGVPCAPVNTVPEALADPQVQALGLLQDVPGEDFQLTGLPLSFDGERPRFQSAAPRLGEHNAQGFKPRP
mgnify:CR=1 FL=1